MKNFIILFTNLKGGTGKTTLCSLFGTMLALCGMPVIIGDADTQLSLWKNRRDDLKEHPEAKDELPWQVFPLPVNGDIQEKIKEIKKIQGIVLIDCPGTIDNQNLQYLFKVADMAVMPFRYDRMNVRETGSFSDIFRKFGKATIMYLPNMVTQYDNKRDALVAAQDYARQNFIRRDAFILPGISESLAVRDTDTLDIDYKTKRAVMEPFMAIINKIKELSNK